MMKKRFLNLAIDLGVLSGGVLAGAAVPGRIGEQRREEKGMSDTHFMVNHVQRKTDRRFEDVTTAFEQQLGRFDPDVYKSLAASQHAEPLRARIEAMAGPSGFMLFATNDHGGLLRIAGQKRKASAPTWVSGWCAITLGDVSGIRFSPSGNR